MNAGWSSVGAAVLVAVGLVGAAPASADATDDAVVSTLAKRNIMITDRDTTLAQAHQVCAGLDNHYKSSFLAMKLVKDTDLSLKDSSYFIGVAVSAYCPQYAGRTDPSANWLNPGPPLL